MEEKSEKPTNIEHINDILSNDELSNHLTQKTKLKTKLKQLKRKYKRKPKPKPQKKIYKERSECSECNKIRLPSDENNQICYTCFHAKKGNMPSGNKIIDDFINYTHTNNPRRINVKMIYVPYEKFKNIELIGEGGFSKIYKATWIDCKISPWGLLDYSLRNKSKIVALKKLNNSKNVTSKELNELKIFYHYSFSYYDLYDIYSSYVNIYYGITQDPVTQDLIFIMPYYDSDLTHYITKCFFNIDWYYKILKLQDIIYGLAKIHDVNIIHRDLHSGNILLECWHSDPEKRPTAAEVSKKIQEIWRIDTIFGGYSKTKIIISSDIGPVTTNNPDAIYKSRYLSGMIKSAASTRSLRSQSITVKLDQLDFDQRNSNVKRKFEDNQFENNFINGTSNKKIKPIEDKNNVYATKELEFDIDINSSQSKDDGYITREIDFDIFLNPL
ncbi:kinase-like domain-containing protein [Rhizophagus irregularis DAOM 181602=DAOM 197198]|nr:kinase-like domain-containing protein [Rhizophagus irregularis DAOM 181602=DAOM 197198]